MLIPVMLKDGTIEKVSPLGLENLILADLVIRFKRNGGWVLVGKDPTRSFVGQDYVGIERRTNNLLQADP
jgi:hypothetical protein